MLGCTHLWAPGGISSCLFQLLGAPVFLGLWSPPPSSQPLVKHLLFLWLCFPVSSFCLLYLLWSSCLPFIRTRLITLDLPGQSRAISSPQDVSFNNTCKVPFVIQGNTHRSHGLGHGYLLGGIFSIPQAQVFIGVVFFWWADPFIIQKNVLVYL